MVHGVPHGSLVNPDPPGILPRNGWWNVAVAHGVVPGHVFRARHEPGEVELRGNILDTSVDYIALGHVHIREQVGINAWYSGSTERTSWGDQSASPGWALVTLDKPGSMPIVEFQDVPARPMETLTPIDGADRDARELATIILERAAALGKPDAMLRVELQKTPRPLFRETEAIVRRETGEAAWLIRLTAPGDLLDPLGREAVSGLADLHPLALFDTFVRQREEAEVYEAEFAERFRTRGRAALEAAIRRSQEAVAIEGAA
jgi:DNA repair exonuclease SbcCD nuclease subunit